MSFFEGRGGFRRPLRLPAGPPFIEAALFTRDPAWHNGTNLPGYKERGGQVQSRMQLLLCGGRKNTVVFILSHLSTIKFKL